MLYKGKSTHTEKKKEKRKTRKDGVSWKETEGERIDGAAGEKGKQRKRGGGGELSV